MAMAVSSTVTLIFAQTHLDGGVECIIAFSLATTADFDSMPHVIIIIMFCVNWGDHEYDQVDAIGPC